MGIDARFLERRPPVDAKMLVDFRQGSSRDEISGTNASVFRDSSPSSSISNDSTGGFYDLNGLTGGARFTSLEYSLANLPWLNIAMAQPICVACWAKPEDVSGNTAYRTLMHRQDTNNTTFNFGVFQDIRRIQVARLGAGGNVTYATSNSVYVNNSWQHFAFTFNSSRSAGNRIKIYVNGVSLATTASSDTIPTTTITAGPIVIGSSYLFIDGFYGNLTKAQLYFSDLSDQDILDLYNGGR